MSILTAPPIQFDDRDLMVRFDRFDTAAYGLFLRLKVVPDVRVEFDPETETHTMRAPKRFAAMLGVQAPPVKAPDLRLSDFLYDDQAAIVPLALEAKRFAVWSDCGLGKTLIELEYARHVIHRTGRRVLLVTMSDIVDQIIDEAAKFYGEALPVHRIESRADLREWCAGDGPGLAITNYEKFNPEDGDNANQVIRELRLLAGIILDESSRLKTGGGKQKWSIIHSSKGIEYKLSATATPAPNDWMEFASQASFLEQLRSEGEILWTYFIRDEKTHRWTVKKHAREAFFQFMASWSIYVKDPRKYGWRLDHKPIPEPVVIRHDIEITPEQLDEMRRLQRDATGQLRMFEQDNTNAIERVKLSEVAKGFRYHQRPIGDPDIPAGARRVKHQGTDMMRWTRYIPSRKPEFVAKLAADEMADGRRVLIWTQFDAETDLIAAQLQALGITADVVTGRVAKKDRKPILDRFRSGQSAVPLIGRPKMLGFGQNFQACTSMIFSGWNDSYEEFYQALRRSFRHGQTEQLRVHIPCIAELEGDMLDNIFTKQAKHLAAIDEMETNYLMARKGLAL